MLVNYN